MAQRNKILSKKLNPYIVVLSAYCIASLLTSVAITTNLHFATKDSKNAGSYTAMATVSSLGIIIAGLLLYSILETRKIANKFASDTVRSYIEQLIAEHPELKVFQSVFDNPKHLKKLATLISNELPPSEQTEVLKVVSEIEKIEPGDQLRNQKIEKMRQNIVNIIKYHNSIHPEFFDKIYSELLNASYSDYVKEKQTINAKLIRESMTK